MSAAPSVRRPGPVVVLVLLAAAGGLGLVASAQPWWRARAEGAQISFSGSEVSGGLSQALGVVLLAGVLLSLTLRSRGRRVLALVLGLGAAGMLAVGLLRQQPSPDAVRDRVRQVSLADTFDLVVTIWPWIFGAAGLAALIGAVLLFWAAPRWPGRRSRFERTAAPLDAGDDPAAAWQALDAGLDPTADRDQLPGRADDAPGADPDVREPDPGVTMERKPGTQPPR